MVYPEVKAELKRSVSTTRFDLFAKVEDLTQEEAEEEKGKAVMFPCFGLSRSQPLHWLSGISMLTDEEPWFVTSVVDQIEAACLAAPPYAGSLLTRKSKCEIIEQEFVFGKRYPGLIHSKLQHDVGIPWVAWSISSEEFIVCK